MITLHIRFSKVDSVIATTEVLKKASATFQHNNFVAATFYIGRSKKIEIWSVLNFKKDDINYF